MLRISRRSSPESFVISMRAVSGCVRISDEIEVSVLNRKCGLIWLASASILAASSSFSCSSSRCSMRALFQILIGVATPSTVASRMTRQASRTDRLEEEETLLMRAPAEAERLANQLEADRREQQHHLPVDLPARAASARRAPAGRVKTNGEKCQIASFGHSSRRPPPANPQPTAKGSAMNSPLASGGSPTISADDGAGVGPGDEAGEEGAFERQVGGLVVQEQARDDARRQRNAEREDEDQPVGPVAALEDQDVAEPPVADQHGRQCGHDGQLHDQRREQHLLGGERCLAGHP